MAEIQPMEQFLIHKVSWLPAFGVTVPGLGYRFEKEARAS